MARAGFKSDARGVARQRRVLRDGRQRARRLGPGRRRVPCHRRWRSAPDLAASESLRPFSVSLSEVKPAPRGPLKRRSDQVRFGRFERNRPHTAASRFTLTPNYMARFCQRPISAARRADPRRGPSAATGSNPRERQTTWQPDSTANSGAHSSAGASAAAGASGAGGGWSGAGAPEAPPAQRATPASTHVAARARAVARRGVARARCRLCACARV